MTKLQRRKGNPQTPGSPLIARPVVSFFVLCVVWILGDRVKRWFSWLPPTPRNRGFVCEYMELGIKPSTLHVVDKFSIVGLSSQTVFLC